MRDNLIKSINEYTELTYLELYNRNTLYKNKEIFIKLKKSENNINCLINKINDFNKPYGSYCSYADALLMNSIIIKNIPNEIYVHKNKFFEDFIKNRNINLIKCVTFQNSLIGDSILDDIRDEFLHRELKSDEEIKEYIYYFLRTGSPHERIKNLDLIKEKIGVDYCSKVKLDGECLAKYNFNLYAQSPVVKEYKRLLFEVFKNEETFKNYQKYYEDLENEIPF